MASPSTGTRHPLRAPARRRRYLALLAGSFLVSWMAMAAVVSMHPPSGGGELRIPVMLYGDTDEYVSGLQFDLAYDPTQFELVGITAGDAATGAGKEVILSETIPGQGRVLITGFNNNGIADGQVATLTLRPLNGNAQQHDISLGQVLASDPDGNSVPIDYADLFQYPPAPPMEEEAEVAPDDMEGEAIDDSPEESPGAEGPDESGTPEGGEPTPDDGNGGTSTNSGVFGNGFAGSGDGRLDSPEGKEDGESKNSTTPPTRTAQTSGASGRMSGRTSQPDGSVDGRFSTGGGGRSGSPATENVARPSARAGVLPPHTGAPAVRGDSTDTREDSTTPVELALLRPASGLIDSPATNPAAYTLALEPTAVKETQSGTRTLIAALTLALTLALLAIANLLFGRVSRPQWRKSR